MDLTPELLKEIVSSVIAANNEQNYAKQETNFHVKPPEPFNFQDQSTWAGWIKRFKMFRSATGLLAKSEDQQINMLLYAMGKESDELLTSIGMPEEERATFDSVVEKFDNYFSTKKNIFYHRAIFLQRIQGSEEQIDPYINDLHKMSERCEWICKDCKSRSFNDEMILLKLVTSIKDKSLSKHLQLQEDLTLNKTVQTVRQAEAMEEQRRILLDTADSSVLEARRGHPQSVRQTTGHSGRGETAGKTSKFVNTRRGCSRCGSSQFHSKEKCPASDKVCFKCGWKGHFGRFCKNASRVTVDEVESLEDSEGNIKLGSIVIEESVSEARKSEPFYVKLCTNGLEVLNFKIDTGADVSCMGLIDARRLGIKIQQTDIQLKGPGNVILEVLGKSHVTLKRGDITHVEEIFILSNQREPLLGRVGISAFGLLKELDEVKLTQDWLDKYPRLFSGLGKFPEPYIIKLRHDYVPVSVDAPRRIPVSLKEKVKIELGKMVDSDVIAPVTEATEWCSPLVVVPKKSGAIRLCVDFTALNKYVERERLILPSVDETLAQMSDAKVFSKLDTNSGFWQVSLDEKSAKLTTFITPFRRFHFKRLPFGINSAPEHFQRKMSKCLEGLDGVANLTDDICVYGNTKEEHDERLDKVLSRLMEEGITLNSEKCEFTKSRIKFLGHIIENGHLQPDPEKTAAIEAFPFPHNQTELKRFLGMVNYLMKFLPNLSNNVKPLNERLSTKNDWHWTDVHEKCFNEVKKMIVSSPVLRLYDPSLETRVCADASKFGLGAILEQKFNDQWRPVQYASRTMSDTEMRYAQIEKEALSLTWACEKFYSFILGKQFDLVTDHKPLLQILGQKPLSDLTPRLQRFRMRLLVFDYVMKYETGKSFFVPDALSRAPMLVKIKEKDILDEDTELYVNSIVSTLPCTDSKLEIIRQAVKDDMTCDIICKAIDSGDWTNLKNTEFFREHGNLTFVDGLILRGERIFIPKKLRGDILGQIHSGYFGVNKCLARSRESVWWPGISIEIKRLVQNCPSCLENRGNPAEPLLPSKLPTRPWEVVGTDLLDYKKNIYLCIQDYFSKYIELVSLSGVNTNAIKQAYLSIFSRHGIPNIVRSDNGTALVSYEMRKFASELGFTIATSSPHFPQSNGQAERAVEICKGILKKNKDPYLGLLAHRASPLDSGVSPAELLFGRKIRTTLPSVPEKLNPGWPNLSKYRTDYDEKSRKNKLYYDRRHRARDLSVLKNGDSVWITDLKRYGTVVGHGPNVRDYVIKSNESQLRRNRRFLIPARSTRQIDSPWLPYAGIELSDGNKDEKVTRGGGNLEGIDQIEVRQEQPRNENRPHGRMADGRYITRSGREVKPTRRYE